MSFDTKSLLAKLMATENLTVEQRKVSTASFDVKNRILTIPILDEKMSTQLYDLFMGHEVGHALYTPLEGMQKAKDENMNMSILNVVEDARIERKIKYKYPGLKNSFIRAYRELMERDFFETLGKDLNALNFIDKANMHFKGGADLTIRFSEFERELIDAIDSTETYEDVVDVAKRITDYMKEQQQEQNITEINMNVDISDLDLENLEIINEPRQQMGSTTEENSESSSENESSGESEKESEEKINAGGAGSNSSDEKGEKEDKKASGSGRSDNKKDDEIRSHTDDAYKKNENKLFANESNEYIYANIPKLNPKDFIIDCKEFCARLIEENYEVAYDKFRVFKNDSNKVVSYLVKEFELRKNADQLKRASIAKSGDLNLNRIYSYKFAEDLFKKVSVVPNGKSHGLVMFLDWSGSMTTHIGNTVKQLLNLVMFCKKVNIPFEVYSFVEESYKMHRPIPKNGDLRVDPFALINILSNRMSTREFTIAAGALMSMAGIGCYHRAGYTPDFMRFSSTPLNQSIIAAMELVPEFQKRNKLQVVNTVFLTDGESDLLNFKYRADGSYDNLPFGYSYSSKLVRSVVLRDPKTMHQEKYNSRGIGPDSQTNALIALLKHRTNSHVIGFYVTTGHEFKSRIPDFLGRRVDWSERDNIRDQFRKDKYYVIDTTAFNEYYVLRSNSLDTDEDNEFVVKGNATTRGLVTAFNKYAGGRVNNRVILNRFIGLIA